MTLSGISDAAVAALRRFWIIIALLFLIRLINYLDRQSLSVLKTTLAGVFGFDDIAYSHLILAFMLPYIIMYVASGWIIDWLGTRRAMTMFVSIWSIAGICSGLAQSYGQLALSRMVLGAAEPAVFPLSQRVVLNWAPERLRALAFSVIAPAGSVGAVLAPPMVATMALTLDWRGAFILPGVLGLVMAALWWRLDRPQARLGEVSAERAEPLRVGDLLRNRDFWAIVTARFVSDPVWFFFLFWIPGYLQERLGLSLAELGLVGGIPYLAALVICPVFGRIVDRQVAKGRDAARAQLMLYAIIAAAMPLGALITVAPNVATAIAIITVVTAGCQAWFAGTGILIAARIPHRLNPSAAGFIGAIGATAGLLFNLVAGGIVQQFGYVTAFSVLACLHPAAAAILWAGLRRGGNEWNHASEIQTRSTKISQ